MDHIIFRLPYVIGSTESISINYEVENFGESAYLAQINISIFGPVFFNKVPSQCKLTVGGSMICDLVSGQPMRKGAMIQFKVPLDTSKLSGKSFTVQANVFSSGQEANVNDNAVIDVIQLAEFSNIEVIG